MSAAPPPGYHWRPARLEDAAALAGLLTAVDGDEGLEEVLSPEGVRYFLAYPGLDPGRDTLGAFAPDGAARGRSVAWGGDPRPGWGRVTRVAPSGPLSMHRRDWLHDHRGAIRQYRLGAAQDGAGVLTPGGR